MESRIIARYLIKEGYNEINDREVDLDEHKEVEVKSLEDGAKACLNDLHGNGIGTITEEKETQYGWQDVRVHQVDGGKILRTDEA